MNRNGQSIIEYTLIAVLVILGIVYMGPYVLRSINAHFKLWDEGIHDSFKEHLQQAPLSHVPPISATCNCTPTSPGCGSIQAGALCGSGQRVWYYGCVPQGCNEANSDYYCKDDPGCCSTYSSGNCGTDKLPLNMTTRNNRNYDAVFQAHETGTTSCSSLGINIAYLPGAPHATCSPPDPSGGCYYGQRIYASQCPFSGTGTGTSTGTGTGTGTYSNSVVCVTDPGCNPFCEGYVIPNPSSTSTATYTGPCQVPNTGTSGADSTQYLRESAPINYTIYPNEAAELAVTQSPTMPNGSCPVDVIAPTGTDGTPECYCSGTACQYICPPGRKFDVASTSCIALPVVGLSFVPINSTGDDEYEGSGNQFEAWGVAYKLGEFAVSTSIANGPSPLPTFAITYMDGYTEFVRPSTSGPGYAQPVDNNGRNVNINSYLLPGDWSHISTAILSIYILWSEQNDYPWMTYCYEPNDHWCWFRENCIQSDPPCPGTECFSGGWTTINGNLPGYCATLPGCIWDGFGHALPVGPESFGVSWTCSSYKTYNFGMSIWVDTDSSGWLACSTNTSKVTTCCSLNKGTCTSTKSDGTITGSCSMPRNANGTLSSYCCRTSSSSNHCCKDGLGLWVPCNYATTPGVSGPAYRWGGCTYSF